MLYPYIVKTPTNFRDLGAPETDATPPYASLAEIMSLGCSQSPSPIKLNYL